MKTALRTFLKMNFRQKLFISVLLLNLFLWSDVFKTSYDYIFQSEVAQNTESKLVCDNHIWTSRKKNGVPNISEAFCVSALNNLRDQKSIKKKVNITKNNYFILHLNLFCSLNSKLYCLHNRDYLNVISLRGPPAPTV